MGLWLVCAHPDFERHNDPITKLTFMLLYLFWQERINSVMIDTVKVVSVTG